MQSEQVKEDDPQAQLQRHMDFERLVTGLSANFINLSSGEVDKGINQALMKIGEFAGVDRTYIFLFSDNIQKMSNTHEWCAEGIASQMPDLQNLSTQDFAWFMARIKEKQVVNIKRVSELPPEAQKEKETFLSGNIRSLLNVPIIYRGSLAGFLGFDSVKAEKEWPQEDIDLLSIVGEMLINSIERKHVEDALRESLDKYGAILESYDGLIYICSPDYKIEFVNKHLIERTGYDPVGQNCHKALHNLDAPCPWCENEKVFKGEIMRWEILSPKDNRWYYVINSPIFHADGRVSKMAMIQDVTERKKAEERLVKLNECFLKFGSDHLGNINLLTALCGELLKADCALYSRLDCGLLHSWGRWNSGNNPGADKPDGHICYDVIKQGGEDCLVIRNLPDTPYAQSDPGIMSNGFKTYIGKAVKLSGSYVGSLCVLYRHDYIPSADDKRVMDLIAIAIAVEENRKDADESLRESEGRYRTLAENAQDYIFIIDEQLRIKYVNAFSAQLIGAKPEELIGRSLRDVFPSDFAEFLQKDLSSIFGSGRSLSSEHKLEVGGHKFWLHTKAMPIKDETGKVVSVMGIARDITERKNMEEALLQSERFLSEVFSSTQDGISVLDSELNIIRVNHMMEEWHDYKMPLVGKKCYDAYHDASVPCKVCPSLKALKTGKAAYEVVPWSGKDGQTIGWFDLYSFPLIDTATGKIKGVIEYVRDITGRKKAEAERESLNNQLVKTNKRLKQLALRDQHTGLYNHRYLQEIIEAEFYRTRRYAQSLSVMMLDIDYFKSINDVYGHQFGDIVLKQFSKILRQMVRRYDTVIRYGGEEFIVICSGSDRANTMSLAKRILDAINLFDFGNRQHSVKLKISISVASYPEDRATKGINLVELADQILNRVKESGGNRVYSALDIKKAKPAPATTDKSGNVKTLKEKIDKLNKNANQSLIEAIFAFAKTIEFKDHYTGEHVEKTVKYATEIARNLDLPEHDIELIRQASMLHDLGKVGISEKILLKRGKLTQKEFTEIKKHPQIGVDIIRPIHFLHPIIPILLYHHERWDGKGYPSGLKGDDIPVGARIVAIADVYQALISDRPYRKAYPVDKAISIVREESGRLFDPEIVATFLRIIRDLQ